MKQPLLPVDLIDIMEDEPYLRYCTLADVH